MEAAEQAAPAAGSPSYFGDDFGQKIDLTVRIREILRNYPGAGLGAFLHELYAAENAHIVRCHAHVTG